MGVSEAVARDGSMLRWADRSLQHDFEVALPAVKQSVHNLRWVPDSLVWSPEFLQELLQIPIPGDLRQPVRGRKNKAMWGAKRVRNITSTLYEIQRTRQWIAASASDAAVRSTRQLL